MSTDHTISGQASARPRFLPTQLIIARTVVMDALSCLDLSFTARRVLYDALAFFNLGQPHRGIWPRRETLRIESMLNSVTTLYRGLAELEQKGYITREQLRLNEKGREGVFHVSPIKFTQKALILLGIDQVIHNERSSEMVDGSIYKEPTKHQQSLQNTVAPAKAEIKNEIDKIARLPTDLVPLLKLGVKRSAICWLMGIAKLHGKRLSDVVKVVWESISALSGREVVAYLRALVKRDLDFRFMAKEKINILEEQQHESKVIDALQKIDYRYVGFEAFCNGRSLGVIEAGGEEFDGYRVSSSEGSIPVNKRFVDAWISGRISLRPSDAHPTHYLATVSSVL